jgi:hypothetical protein
VFLSANGDHVSFRWKDRAKGDAPRVETISGVEKHRRHGGVLDATSAASEARRLSSRGALRINS